MTILKNKINGGFTVMASGDKDDDLLKTIIDNCHLIDVTIHLKNESKKTFYLHFGTLPRTAFIRGTEKKL